MTTFRSLETISLNMIDFLRIVQPNLDVKPGSVARDIAVDLPAQELAKLYVELRNIANLQAIATATGTDLDKLARNFGLVRGSGARATGVAVLTTNVLDSDINIASNSVVTARNGATFRTLSQAAFLEDNSGVYRANALRLRTDLDLAGVSDEFALEVAVEATNPGAAGNIGKFALTSVNIPGVANITNLQSFTGGASTEQDDAFRARVLGVFAGSNTGTALGYINSLLVDPRISDVLTVEPGDPLMTRDGTQISVNDAGETVIVSSGTGGKVDIYIQGTNLESTTQSFIYRDQSGKNDPTDSRNDFVLGQRGLSTLLDFQQRRQLSLSSGQLPFQPIETITSVSGSLSGPNFTEAFVDDEGNTRGSFELVKDDGAFGGSPFGFDTLSWVSGAIELIDENSTKGPFNGQDALDFTDITEISQVRQKTVINNENPSVSSTDRSLLQLDHTPITSIERVVNLTTGERYVVSDANVDGETGEQNLTGRIQVSGNTLPTLTDVLQVNYIWNLIFDENLDYDDLSSTSEFRTVQDSIDWGFSNRVIAEEQSIVYSSGDGYHVVLEHPSSKVVNVNTRVEETVTNSSGKLVVSNTITNIFSVTDNSGREVFFTTANNGSFSGKEITLPTDSVLASGADATVIYNLEDLFSPDGYDAGGTFSGNVVVMPDTVTTAGTTVYVDYVANINTLLPTTALVNLPAVGSDNNFVVSGSIVGNQPVSNIYSADTIVSNLKFAPTYLNMSIEGIPSRGQLTINGTSFRKIEAVLVIQQDSLTIDLASSIRSSLGLSAVPSTGFVSFVDRVERVTVEGDQVTGVEAVLDTLNYELNNVDYSNGMAIANSSLTRTQIKLSSTTDNLAEIPSTGQRVRVVYYYSDSNQTENLTISAAGRHISQFKYVFINSVSVASGFTGLSGNVSGTITITNLNQPTTGNTYLTSYEYVAPKEGERITIEYTYNRLISDATQRIESVRPITADVLIKAATAVSVDVSMTIVAASNFQGTESTLVEGLRENLTSFLSANGLNTTLDSSDVVNAAYGTAGVDRVVLTKFNTSGNTGILKTIQAGRNEYLTAGVIEISVEER